MGELEPPPPRRRPPTRPRRWSRARRRRRRSPGRRSRRRPPRDRAPRCQVGGRPPPAGALRRCSCRRPGRGAHRRPIAAPRGPPRRRVRTRTPSRSSAVVTTADASGSSSDSSRSSTSTMVTVTPRRAKAWASSQPMAPPPSTASEPGEVVRSHTVSLVRASTSSRPGTGGSAGPAPAATMTRSHRRTCPSTSTRPGPAKVARPSTTSMPSLRNVAASSVAATSATVDRTRAMASSKPQPPGRRRQQGLGRDTAGEGAVAAGGAVVDEGDGGAEAPGRAGRLQTRRTAADDQEITHLTPTARVRPPFPDGEMRPRPGGPGRGTPARAWGGGRMVRCPPRPSRSCSPSSTPHRRRTTPPPPWPTA